MAREVTTKAGSKRTASKSKGTRKRTSASAETKKVVGKLKRISRSTEPPATSQDPIQLPEETRPLPKTYLTDDDLQKFTELLLRKRAELAGDVDRLTREALNTKGAGHGERSAMPIHMADLGSDNWEQEFTLGLIANERALVREIDEALERIEKRTYGVCIATGKRITKARLRAKPWAKYCIEYARAREEGRAP